MRRPRTSGKARYWDPGRGDEGKNPLFFTDMKPAATLICSTVPDLTPTEGTFSDALLWIQIPSERNPPHRQMPSFAKQLGRKSFAFENQELKSRLVKGAQSGPHRGAAVFKSTFPSNSEALALARAAVFLTWQALILHYVAILRFVTRSSNRAPLSAGKRHWGSQRI